ncbi:MAG TPA: tetratricopeptide repeat protein, partial [Mucilaginibacter sp.]
MKKLLLLFCFAFTLSPVWAQQKPGYRLKDLIFKIKTDTIVDIVSVLKGSYVANYPDSGIYYAKELITYGRQNNDRHILASGLNIYSYALYNKGNYPVALNLAFQSLKIIENSTYTRELSSIYNLIGNIYKGQQNYSKALYYYRRGKQSALVSHNRIILSVSYFNMAFVFKETNVLDSALYYSQLAVKDNNDATGQWMGYILSTLGDEHLKLKNYKKALEYYQAAYKL